MTNIAVFSSGQGSTFEHLIKHLNSQSINIKLLVSDRSTSGAITKAKAHNISTAVISPKLFESFNDWESSILDVLQKNNINFIVLAGFLKKIGSNIIKPYHKKIINTHPSLLPKFGGKGMYGKKIHQKVIENKELKTGATIHFVSAEYDKGEIINQKSFDITTQDTALTIEKKVKAMEKILLIQTLEKLLR